MKLSVTKKSDFLASINQSVSRETSVVRRYLDAVSFEDDEIKDREFKALANAASIREGARIFPCFEYRGVHVSILDETTLMSTGDLEIN